MHLYIRLMCTTNKKLYNLIKITDPSTLNDIKSDKKTNKTNQKGNLVHVIF